MSEPIRVLQVLAGMNRGGTEAFVMNIYRNIDRTKVQFDFILFRKEECDFNEEIRNLGGKIYWIPRYNGKNHFKFKRAWRVFFKEHPEYRIIHGHVRSTASIYLKIANKHKLTTIAHSHSTSSRGSKIEQLVKYIIQFPIRNTADHLFACSDKAGEWLFGAKSTVKSNYRIINNAIEPEIYKYNEKTRDEKRKALCVVDKFVVGHLGSFTHPKNHTFLLDIFKEVHDKKEDTVLLLVGDGELRSLIEKKIKDLNLTKSVILTGVRPDVPELLQAMDILVFPSLFEGVPVALIEAQASGLSCIVADTITKEAGLSDSLKFMSLGQGPVKWSDQILKSKNDLNRKEYCRIVKEKGYDIFTEANWLQNFYLDSRQIDE